MDCKCKIEFDEKGQFIYYCPLHATAGGLLEALKNIWGLVEDNTLVRNISRDNEKNYYLEQGLRIVHVLGKVQVAIAKAEEGTP